jgi:hypothetical protein
MSVCVLSRAEPFIPRVVKTPFPALHPDVVVSFDNVFIAHGDLYLDRDSP